MLIYIISIEPENFWFYKNLETFCLIVEKEVEN